MIRRAFYLFLYICIAPLALWAMRKGKNNGE